MMEIRRRRETILELGRKPEVNLIYFILFLFFCFCFIPFHQYEFQRGVPDKMPSRLLLATSHWNYISIYYYTNTYEREPTCYVLNSGAAEQVHRNVQKPTKTRFF